MEVTAKKLNKEINEHNAHVLGKTFWRLMQNWNIKPQDQALLLGVKYHATKLKDWQKKELIPEDPDKFLRVGHLIGIHKNLRIIFPYNRRAAYDFMQTTQSFLFGGKTPLELIREGGALQSLATISAIRRRLDQLRV